MGIKLKKKKTMKPVKKVIYKACERIELGDAAGCCTAIDKAAYPDHKLYDELSCLLIDLYYEPRFGAYWWNNDNGATDEENRSARILALLFMYEFYKDGGRA